MNPDRWRQVEAIFLAAADMDATARHAYLNDACAHDPSLRAEVDAMLAADNPNDSLVESTVASFIAAQDNAAGRTIGSYSLVKEIGKGGMGAVYEAVRTDGAFSNRVAIKLMRRSYETDQFLPRFLAERQILARLNHPNIARLLDGGTTPEGEPYIVMELVEGEPITTYCREHQPPLIARLQLFLGVCEAVQHAHQHLVVHRDLKPSNILVTRDAQPKLLDFGIAKILEDSSVDLTAPLTMGGMLLLTPEHASPEQVRGDAITTSTDVYSLGTILYEMLTGVRAHQIPSRTEAAIHKAVCDTTPPPPSLATGAFDKHLAGDLDNIVLMALRKEPARRYVSVEQFATDIRRYLADLPVFARRETFTYRMRKFARRNRIPIAAAAIAAIGLLTGAGIALQQARRAERQFQEVRKLANAFLHDVNQQAGQLSGAMPLRQTVVRIGLDYLDRLSSEARRDPALSLEIAQGYLRIGEAQGYPVVPNLGQQPEALRSFLRAHQILEALAKTNPSQTVLLHFARAHHRTAFLYRQTGDFASATAMANAGLAIAEQVYSGNPNAGENVRARSELLHLNAELLGTTGNITQAAQLVERSRQAIEQWAAARPSLESREMLAMIHWRIARDTYYGIPNALTHAEQSIGILEKLIREFPANASLRRDLWNVTGVRAMLQFRHSDPAIRAQAAATQESMIRMGQELYDADPLNRRAVSDLHLAYRQSCAIFRKTNPQRALADCQKGERLAEAITAEAPGFLTMIRLQIADVLVDLNRRDEARALLEKARTHQQQENYASTSPVSLSLLKQIEERLNTLR